METSNSKHNLNLGKEITLFGRVSIMFVHDYIRVQLPQHHIAIDVPKPHDIIVLSNGEFSPSACAVQRPPHDCLGNLKVVSSSKGGWTTTALDVT